MVRRSGWTLEVGVEKMLCQAEMWESFFVIIAISIMRRLVAWSQMVAPSLEVILFTCLEYLQSIAFSLYIKSNIL